MSSAWGSARRGGTAVLVMLIAAAVIVGVAPAQGAQSDSTAGHHLAILTLVEGSEHGHTHVRLDAQGPSAIGPAASTSPGTVDEHDFDPFIWRQAPIIWFYNPDGVPRRLGDAALVLGAAAEAWNDVGAPHPAFQFGGKTDAPASACDGVSDGQNTVGWGVLPGDALAMTCVLYRPDGELGSTLRDAAEFDMVISYSAKTGTPAWTTEVFADGIDLQTAVMHEFGHALGLPHAEECPGAAMCALLTAGTVLRSPLAGDIAVLDALYDPPTAIGEPAIALSLPAGTSPVSWIGQFNPTADIVEASRGAIRAIYAWDGETDRFLRYVPGAPSYVNTLDVLAPGVIYWFVAQGPFTIEL